MDFVKAEIDVRIKGFLVPETFKEKLTYYFKEQTVLYEVYNDFEITLSNGNRIKIKKGFVHDLKSVPPFLQSFKRSATKQMIAHIVHDWLYKTDYLRDELGDELAKEFADNEMRIIANKFSDESEKWNNDFDYFMVKWFGNSTFKRRKEEEIN